MRRSHLCEHCDSCEVSIWRPCFNIDLPCLESYLLIFQVSLSHLSAWSFPLFWFSSSDFSSQTFQFFWVSPSHFFESTLLIFLSQYLPLFSGHSFPFWGQSSQYFRVGPSHFFESVLRIFLSQIFPFCLADFYLIGPSSFYSSWVSLEDVFDLRCQLRLYFLITKLVEKRY